MCDQLGITDWDLLLIGDGSGQGWGMGCGWSCLVIDKATHARKMLHGGSSSGTISIAELSAYVFALLWFANEHGATRIKQKGSPLNVHIITDSRLVVNTGNKIEEDEGSDKVANKALWAALASIQRQGYNLNYHWMERMQLEANWAADQLAGKSRIALSDVELTQDGEPISIYDLNKAGKSE